MDKWVIGERFSADVLDTCAEIHGHVTGSWSSLSVDGCERAVAWLRWRTGEGWDGQRETSYDVCVRALAASAIALADKAGR